jgi:hypothetical protein
VVLAEAAAEVEALGEGREVTGDTEGLVEATKVLDGVLTGELLVVGIREGTNDDAREVGADVEDTIVGATEDACEDGALE